LATSGRRGALATREVESAPELGASVSVPQVHVPATVVGYRRLAAELPVTPGQRISWPGPLALALAPAAAAATLAVVLPAGTAVGVSSGSAVLPSAVELEVLAVSTGMVVAQPAAVVA
jgi:hypothetical protein